MDKQERERRARWVKVIPRLAVFALVMLLLWVAIAGQANSRQAVRLLDEARQREAALREEIDGLKTQLAAVEERLGELTERVEALIDRLVELGVDPEIFRDVLPDEEDGSEDSAAAQPSPRAREPSPDQPSPRPSPPPPPSPPGDPDPSPGPPPTQIEEVEEAVCDLLPEFCNPL